MRRPRSTSMCWSRAPTPPTHLPPEEALNSNETHPYQSAIAEVAQQSPLAEEIPSQWRQYYTPFHILYESVRAARNDALHQGAFARHLTVHAIQLAIVLEDALMQNLTTVGDYMVQNPVYAATWQPVGFIR